MKANSLPNLAQLRVDDCGLSTANTTNMEKKSEIWFWNESANKTNLDIEEEKNGNHKNNLEGDEIRIEEVVSSEVYKVEIKWSKEGQNKLCVKYRKKSKRT